MASSDSPRQSFWKKGERSNTKLPGRPQQVHTHSLDTELHTMTQTPSAMAGAPGGVARPRSKTFEEYSKETDDIWDDKEEAFSDLSTEMASLEVDKRRARGRPRADSKGKGKSAELKAFFVDVVKNRGSPRSRPRSQSDKPRKAFADQPGSRERSDSPTDFFDPPDRETMRLQKFGKLLAGPNTDLDELRKLSWSGIPSPVRATTWQLLCGYVPANIDRREETLQRKRQEYYNFIDQYYGNRSDPQHIDTFRQISIDVPRMNPEIPLFQQKIVQECFQRVLFIWSMRHPASGYVQGINDLITPFFVVFLSYYISGDKNPETYDLTKLPEGTLKCIEADSFWCMQKMLEGIQDNYTLAQPGIQTKLLALKDLMKRLDESLSVHLTRNSVEYIQFAFRWMNNLLLREFPLRCVIRLWDSYLSERDGFANFHVYVCAALLAHFSTKIKAQKEFQDIMVFLQNLPTTKWRDSEIELLLAEAYKLKFMFADAPGHLTVLRTS
ncbi:TBC1 domain family member 22A-like [Halichondria panicea]|uniref:TBC1 domain family member 22A-like n=1 Tax=Halichondria panicea TaxID=6063 RepID=UPI00312BBD8D